MLHAFQCQSIVLNPTNKWQQKLKKILEPVFRQEKHTAFFWWFDEQILKTFLALLEEVVAFFGQ